MAGVIKRGGVWWARWYGEEKKRIARSTGLTGGKREALARANEMEVEYRKSDKDRDSRQKAYQVILDRAAADAQQGKLDAARAQEHLHDIMRVADPNFRVITVRGCFQDWIQAQKPHVAAGTISNYEDAAKAMLSNMPKRVADGPASELRRQDIEAAMAALKKAGTSKEITINMHLAAFRRALQWAADEKLIKDNPARNIRPLPEEDSDERVRFETEEVAKLLAVDYLDRRKGMAERPEAPEIAREWKGLILLGVRTGMRMGDVKKRHAEEIEKGRIVIRPGKTRKKRRNIVIPLSADVLEWIGDQKKGPLFPHLSKLSAATLSTQFKRIMSIAEVPATIPIPGGEGVRSYHSLRHTFVTWLSEAGIAADVRKKLSGHSTEESHATYVHDLETLAKAIEALPDLPNR